MALLATRSLEEGSSSIEWTRVKSRSNCPSSCTTPCNNMAESEAANANLIVDPETFESQLKALKSGLLHPDTWGSLSHPLVKNEVPKGKKFVWLTFDDGVEDFYTIVYPLLKKLQDDRHQ